MKAIIGVFLFSGVLALISAPLSMAELRHGADLPSGVYCEINDVKLFAHSADDCAKAGGEVTHTVTTTVEPTDSE